MSWLARALRPGQGDRTIAGDVRCNPLHQFIERFHVPSPDWAGCHAGNVEDEAAAAAVEVAGCGRRGSTPASLRAPPIPGKAVADETASRATATLEKEGIISWL